MSNCPKCNAPLRKNQKFCTKCGTQITEVSKHKPPIELAASVDVHEKKIAQDPLNATLYIELGDLYYGNGFYEDALLQYHKAVSVDASITDGQLKSGHSFMKLGKLDRAKDCYEKALRVSPESPVVRSGLFLALKGLGQLEEATVLGKSITAADPSNIPVHQGLRDIYIQTGKEKEAIAELIDIIAIAPSEKANYRQLAQIYIKRKEIDKSLENYRKLLFLEDQDKDALLNIGCLLHEKGDLDESSKYLRKLTAIDPSNVTTLCYLALNDIGKGQLDKAAKDLINLITPNYGKLGEDEKKLLSHTYFILGEKYLNATNLRDAKSYFLKSLEVSQNPDAAKSLAIIYAREGETAFQEKKYKEAEIAFLEALKLASGNREYQEKFNESNKIRKGKERNKVLAITIPVLLVGLAVAAFFLNKHYSTGELIINTLSDDQVESIQVDGNTFMRDQGPLKLRTGEHKIVVKGKPRYQDLTSTIVVKGGDKKEIAISLELAKNGGIIPINRIGKYSGVLKTVSACQNQEGNQYCRTLDVEQESGEVIRGEFGMTVTLQKDNQTIYRYSNEQSMNKSMAEQRADIEEIVVANLIPGFHVEFNVINCGGDSGCYIPIIKISVP